MPALKEMLRRFGQPVTGHKNLLRQRLVDFFQQAGIRAANVRQGRANILKEKKRMSRRQPSRPDVDCLLFSVPLPQLKPVLGSTVTFGDVVRHRSIPAGYFQLCTHPFVFVHKDFRKHIQELLQVWEIAHGRAAESKSHQSLVFKSWWMQTDQLLDILRTSSVSDVLVHIFGQKASVESARQDLRHSAIRFAELFAWYNVNSPFCTAHLEDDVGVVLLAEWDGPCWGPTN